MTDTYINDETLTLDGQSLTLDSASRLYRNGNVLELQVLINDVWVTMQTWGE